MKIAVIGANGQLGSWVLRKLALEHEVVGLNSKQLDIGKEEQVTKVLTRIKPQYIINCAAYNNVNQAEVEVSAAKYVNELGVYHLAQVAKQLKATLIHISTDYVFDGKKGMPYWEEDQPNPLNIYGITKYSGERLIQEICQKYMIIRTSWLYSEKPNNFVHTILNKARQQTELKVINDHFGTPTLAEDLAEVIRQLIHHEGQGIYHASGNGECSWYEFAESILKFSGIKCQIEPISYKAYPELAQKPVYSVLDNKRLREGIGDTMGEWQDTLEKFMKAYKNE